MTVLTQCQYHSANTLFWRKLRFVAKYAFFVLFFVENLRLCYSLRFFHLCVEPPDIAQADAHWDAGEQELNGVVPLFSFRFLTLTFHWGGSRLPKQNCHDGVCHGDDCNDIDVMLKTGMMRFVTLIREPEKVARSATKLFSRNNVTCIIIIIIIHHHHYSSSPSLS